MPSRTVLVVDGQDERKLFQSIFRSAKVMTAGDAERAKGADVEGSRMVVCGSLRLLGRLLLPLGAQCIGHDGSWLTYVVGPQDREHLAEIKSLVHHAGLDHKCHLCVPAQGYLYAIADLIEAQTCA